MIQIASSTVIYRPLAAVFDFISTSANDFEWQYGTLASTKLSEGATRVGTSFRSVGHMMGRRMLGTFEITEYEANHQYGFKSLSGPLDVRTLYALESEAGRTKIMITTRASPAAAFRVRESLMKKFMEKQLKENLAMLKTILEGK